MKKFSLLFLTFLLVLSANAQIKIGESSLPEKVTFNGESLVFNGGGIRTKFFFDIYAGALYLKKKSNKASAIANADETMAIELHIESSMMSRSKMAGALRDGFDKATNGNVGPIKDRVEKFIGFIKDEIEVGQVYDIVYEKGKGSVIYKDGKEKGHVTGLDFKKALFNIWLGDKPADKGLKKGMLGN
ncbi:chalcone isomerase family protein [Aquimarina sp. D1M17]|uniref:chalcone isomerase family protein n=1 Tax=Aquimarina acroporae TaxID=2937283 RepID=UPI0020BDBDB9|nr:chalcone isomerase family protein [Aquimarina acroporae]MCK8520675.1 chalcone isomerase family protein [Aquimarina acroporae]